MKYLFAWFIAAMFSFGVMSADEDFQELDPGALVMASVLFWPVVLGVHFAVAPTTILKKSDRHPACEITPPSCECFPYPCGEGSE